MTPMSTTTTTTTLLRRALVVDAVITGACALLLIAAAGTLASLLGLPALLLRVAGLSLVPFTAFLVYLIRREALPRGAVWVVIACNALWAIDSVLLLMTPWVTPTPLGYAFVIAQAAIVALFAEAQFVGLRRARPSFA